jgi:hypothetical protein
MSAQDSPRETSSLRGRLLLAARASWIVAAVFYAGLCIASVVVTYVAYPKLCGNPNPAAFCVNLGPVDGSNFRGAAGSFLHPLALSGPRPSEKPGVIDHQPLRVDR